MAFQEVHRRPVYPSYSIACCLTTSSKVRYNPCLSGGPIGGPTRFRWTLDMGKLTARKVATAPPGKHDDGDGLRLYVSPSGARKWVYRFMLNGRRREAGLGSLSDISLAQAREKAADHRRLISRGMTRSITRPQRRCRPSPNAPPGSSAPIAAGGATPSTRASGSRPSRPTPGRSSAPSRLTRSPPRTC